MLLHGFIEVSEKHCSPIQMSTFKNELLFWSSFHGSFKSLPTSWRPSHCIIPRLQPLSVSHLWRKGSFQGLEHDGLLVAIFTDRMLSARFIKLVKTFDSSFLDVSE